MTARAAGLIQPVSHQFYYTAEAREAEYELFPAGEELGVSAMIWSPLGQGVLTGKVDRNKKAPAGTRQGTEGWSEPWLMSEERLYGVIDVLKEVAAERRPRRSRWPGSGIDRESDRSSWARVMKVSFARI